MISSPAARTAPDDVAEAGPAPSTSLEIEAAFDRFGRSLYRYVVVRVGGDSQLADDVMQQVWLGALRSGRSVAAGEMELWLKGIARNAIRAHWRTARARPRDLPLPDADLSTELARRLESEPLPQDVLESREVHDQILLAVSGLPADHQELIVGHYFRSRTLAELARAAGISERAVEGRLFRSRQALKHALLHPGD